MFKALLLYILLSHFNSQLVLVNALSIERRARRRHPPAWLVGASVWHTFQESLVSLSSGASRRCNALILWDAKMVSPAVVVAVGAAVGA